MCQCKLCILEKGAKSIRAKKNYIKKSLFQGTLIVILYKFLFNFISKTPSASPPFYPQPYPYSSRESEIKMVVERKKRIL